MIKLQMIQILSSSIHLLQLPEPHSIIFAKSKGQSQIHLL